MRAWIRAGGRALVRVGSAAAVLGAAHAAVNARLLRRAGTSDTVLPPLSVLIPARDEAATIGACVGSARQQGHEVVVLDDESSDGTADLAAAAGARVITGRPLPPGWLGKPWACHQLLEAADPRSEVLVFLDADVRLAPGAVDAATRLLLDRDLDIVCPFPRQLAEGVAERLVQPLLQWSWLTLLPLRLAETSPRPSLTGACGQFLLVRRAALVRAGGFAAVRAAVLDDVALVRAVKASGGRGGVVDGTDLATCRMYDGWSALRDGYAKSLWSAFGSPRAAAGAVAALVLVWVVPPLAMITGSRAGAIGCAAGVAGRAICARRTGSPALPDTAAHPASVMALSYLIARSVRSSARSTLSWKGRPVAVEPCEQHN